MTIDYISVGDLAVFLDVEASALDAATANLATASAMQSVRKYLDQEVTYHAGQVQLLDGSGSRVLRLPERPVRAVTLVEEQSSSGDWTTASDFTLDGDFIFRDESSSPWRRGKRNIRCTYSHGYSSAALDSDTSDSDSTADYALPADISLVTLNASRRIYEASGSEPNPPLATRQETIGSYAVTYAAESIQVVELTRHEKAVLDRYRFA